MIVRKLLLQVKEFINSYRKVSLAFTSSSRPADLLNTLSAKITKWSNTLKQFVGNLPTNCLSVFDYFVRLTLKGLKKYASKGIPCGF